MRNLSTRPRLISAILCVLIFAVEACAQSSDQQSLGDVAKAQRKQKSNAQVIDDDEMARRGIHHGTGAATFDCDADCMQEIRRFAQYNKYYKGMTDEQWQTAFAAAKDELAPGDWNEWLSKIEQEYCRTPGKVNFAQANSLINDMFKKFTLESFAKKIDTMAALAHPDDASGAEAIRQMRIDGLEGSILHEKLTRIQQKCYVPGTQDTSAAHSK